MSSVLLLFCHVLAIAELVLATRGEPIRRKESGKYHETDIGMVKYSPHPLAHLYAATDQGMPDWHKEASEPYDSNYPGVYGYSMDRHQPYNSAKLKSKKGRSKVQGDELPNYYNAQRGSDVAYPESPRKSYHPYIRSKSGMRGVSSIPGIALGISAGKGKPTPKKQLKISNIKYKSCGKSSLFEIKRITVPTGALKIPGYVKIGYDVKLAKNISSPLKAQLTASKTVFGLNLPIPCVNGLGSCTYSDVCTLFKSASNCPAEFKEHNIPCSCPVAKGSFTADNFETYILLDINKLPMGVAVGDYTVKLNLSSGSDSSCYAMKFNISLVNN